MNYKYYKSILNDLPKPLAYVDMDLLNANISQVLKRIGSEKKVRIATKSVRCKHLLHHILQSSPQFIGLMTYDAKETCELIKSGFKNLLIGYPLSDKKLIIPLLNEIKKGVSLFFMVDRWEHLEILSQCAQSMNIQVSICIDIDLSTQFPFLYFGVRRSNITTPQTLQLLLQALKKYPFLKLTGLMGYEAQIAGVGDHEKNQFFKNKLIQILKKYSQKKISLARKNFLNTIREHGCAPEFINGGGTGSIEFTCRDHEVTEITVGSAFYSPHLFDNYQHFKHLPAAGFALEITRQPEKNIFTAHGGGYQASGSSGKEKSPAPFLPKGLSLLKNEGAGEVQTPFYYKGTDVLKIGDPLFLRHAKSGELCERFNELHLIENGKIISSVKTYRGENICTL